MKKKRALISGGQGFVGLLLAAKLRKLGWEVCSERFDVADPNAVRDLGAPGVDVVFHLASPTDVAACEKDPGLAFRVMVDGTINLLAQSNPKARFVLASSSMVYAEPLEGEHVLDESWTVGPTTNYGRDKLQAERLVEHWGKTSGSDHYLLRIFPHTHQSQMASRFLRRLKESLEQTSPSGKLILDQNLLCQGRDIGAVCDLVDALVLLANANIAPGVYNVASGRARKLGRLAEIMAGELGREIEFSKKAAAPVNSYCGSIGKLSRALGFVPSIRTDEELVKYYLQPEA